MKNRLSKLLAQSDLQLWIPFTTMAQKRLLLGNHGA